MSDTRWDEAESEVDRGRAWRFKDEGAPNPLTIQAEEWVQITTEYGETELLTGRDRDGSSWSILVGSKILQKALIDGVFEEWDDDKKAFVVKETLGKVRPGEVVSVKYLGEREGGKFTYSNFAISRKAALPVSAKAEDDIPFAAAPAPEENPFPPDDGVPE